MSFDPKSVDPMDWGILAAGVLTFLLSFISYYKFSVSGVGGIAGGSQSYSAWHDVFGGGFIGWLGIIAALAGTVVIGLTLFAPQVAIPGPVPPRLLALYLFAAAAVLEILALVLHPKFSSTGQGTLKVSFGHGFGYYLCLILTIVAAVLAFLRLQATGGKLPWDKKGGDNNPPQQWQPGGYPPPPQ